MSGPMVRALLAGTKTQTRRPIKPQPVVDGDALRWGGRAWPAPADLARCCRHGHVGDQLWVRESMRRGEQWWSPTRPNDKSMLTFAADGTPLEAHPAWARTLARDSVPSIHMPRWACRLELEITEVRVEHLQDISEADAKAEGARAAPETPRQAPLLASDDPSYRRGFLEVWESIHGAGSWAANPWLWAISFRRITP